MPNDVSFISLLPVQFADVADGTVIRRGSTELLVRGTGVRSILELIFSLSKAGGVSSQEVAEIVSPRFPAITAEHIQLIFDNLVSSRLVVPKNEEGAAGELADRPTPVSIFQWDLGLENAPPLGSRTIALVGANTLSSEIFKSLRTCGLVQIEWISDPAFNDGLPNSINNERQEGDRWRDQGRTPDLLIAASTFGNQSALRVWNQYAIDRNIAFLPVILKDNIGQIGPFVQPGDGPCLECLRARQNAAAEEPELHRATENEVHLVPDATGYMPPTIDLLGRIAAQETVKHLLSPQLFETVGHVIYFDPIAPSLVRKKVLKVPRCRVCSRSHIVSAMRLSRKIPIPSDQAE